MANTKITAANIDSTSTGFTLADLTVNGDINLGDNDKAIFGAGSDLQIYHDSTSGDSRIVEGGTGHLALWGNNIKLLNAAGTETMLDANPNAAVTLYYDNSAKLATSSTGIDVTGDVHASGLLKVGTNDSEYANNYIRFKPTGASYIDHFTVGQDINFRVSNASSLDTTALTIDSSGNVGIGQTPVAFRSNSNEVGIQYGKRGVLFADSGLTTDIANNTFVNSSNIRIAMETDLASYYQQYQGVHKWFNAPSVSAGSQQTFTEAMRIDSSGNVGIGTSSPNSQSKLSLQLPSGTNGRILTMARSAGAYAYHLGIDASSNFTLYNNDGTSSLMAVDSSGNVGIGTSSVTNNTNRTTLGLQGAWGGQLDIMVGSTVHAQFGTDNFSSGQSCRIQSQDGIIFKAGGSSERMRIDSSGNVGIGQTPTNRFDVNSGTNIVVSKFQSSLGGAGNRAIIQLGASGNSQSGLQFIQCGSSSSIEGGANAATIENTENAPLIFGTNNTERMRIDSSGKLLIGTTSASDAQIISRTSGSSYNMYYQAPSLYAGDYRFIRFQAGSPLSTVGSISSNGSTTTYSTSSDYRLKENVDYEFNALERVAQLKPARFNFIADADTTVDGFLAHEVSNIVPEAITGEKDRVDSEGNPEYQGIDQSKLVPLLTKAIQEQQAIIDNLKTRIEALEG